MRAIPLILVAVAASCLPASDDADLDTSSSELVVSAIPRRSTWKYWDRGGDLGTPWRGTFNDSTWASGAGPLGYGESYLSTTVGYGPSSSSKYITTYFRRTFTVDDPSALTGIRGEIMFDDGVVVYLNGQRIGTDSMPAGTTTASTRAVGHEASNAYNVYDWSHHAELLVAGINVIAIEIHQSEPSSSDLVFDLSLELTTAELSHNIAKQSVWAYWDRGGDLGTAWRMPAYDDASWARGGRILGYGEPYIGTTVSYGPDANNKYITTYFRKEFLVDDPENVQDIFGDLLYDDGLLVYINGTRVGTANMPFRDDVTASTPAVSSHEAGLYEHWSFGGSQYLLVSGVNVVAVEAHQVDRTSSDLVFDMALSLDNQPPPPPQSIPAHSEWLYWDKGGDLGTAWRQNDPPYFTGNWGRGNGVLGYGESYLSTTISYGPSSSNKYITSYFRKTFRVDDPSIITSLRGDLMYDDGAVVYINGHEIQRLAMPTGTITAATRSSGHELDNAYETFYWSAAAQYLVAGDNVIAVEIHQQSASSSDLTFDLALQLETSTTCPVTNLPRRDYFDGAELNDVWVGPNGVVWAVGFDGMVGRRAAAEGGAWCWITPGGPNRWIDGIWGTAENNLWIVGEGTFDDPRAFVLQFDGQRFIQHDIGTTGLMRDVWGTGPNDVYVVGDFGRIRHWNGAVWENLDLPQYKRPTGIWGTAIPGEIWIAVENVQPDQGAGVAAEVYRFVPSTRTWTREASYYDSSSRATYPYSIEGSSGSDVYIVGRRASPDVAWAARFSGTTWTWMTVPPMSQPHDAFFDVAPRAPGAEGGAWFAGNFQSMVNFQQYLAPGGGTENRWIDGYPDSWGILAIDRRGSELWAVGRDGKILYWGPNGWVTHRAGGT